MSSITIMYTLTNAITTLATWTLQRTDHLCMPATITPQVPRHAIRASLTESTGTYRAMDPTRSPPCHLARPPLYGDT